MSTQDTTLPPPCGWNTLLKLFFEASATLIKEAQAAESNEHNYEYLIAAVQSVTDYGRQGLTAIAAQAQHPIKLRGTPRKSDYLGGARFYALMYGQYDDAPGYLPRTREQADQFEPHAWVLSAMMQAFGDGWADGHSAGLELMKQAQQGKPGAFEVLDSGTPEYLDGVEAQFSVIKREGPGQWDYKSVCYCFTKEHAEKFCAALAQPEQAQQAQGVPAGWKFSVSHSDGRAWLNITTPAGTQASLSCAHKTGNGDETVAAQVLAYLRDDLLAAAPQAEPQTPAPAQRTELVGTSLGERLDNLINAAKWDKDEVPRLKASLIRDIERCAQAPAAEAEPQPEREPLSEEQLHTVECMDSWATMQGLPAYSELAGIGTKGGDKP